jgi:nucleotide-binding universal stress UspA family protein
MFEHILVPLDGSPLAESILPHVISISSACNAQITLMRVLDQETSLAPVDPGSWSLRKVEGRAYLQEIGLRLDKLGYQCATVLDEGPAAERIIRYAQDNQISLIAMSSHGQSGLSGWNTGSVVQKVLLRSGTSILVGPAYRGVQPDMTQILYERICVPLDCSQRAENVLPVATKIASDHRSSLWLAHVVARPVMPSHLPLSTDEVELANRIVERNQLEAEKYLEDTRYRLPSDLFEIQTSIQVNDKLIEALHEMVEQEGVDLVILNAHGYSACCRFPYGSVALSFIAYGTVPLLILQDMAHEKIRPSLAELAAQEHPVY